MIWCPAAWTDPRFAAYAPVLAALAALPGAPSVADLDRALAPWLGGGPRPIRLVEQTAATGIYELWVADRAEVPTRPGNAHDLWNAVVWATFPRAKWALADRLGALQRVRVGAAGGLPGTRTPDHDRLALVDEGGLIEVGSRAAVFGHAILEHAARGALDVRAAAVALPEVPWTAAAVDVALAEAIATGRLGGGPGVAIDPRRLVGFAG